MCGTNDPSVVVGGDGHTSQGELFLDGLGLISSGLAGRQELLQPSDAASSDEGLF